MTADAIILTVIIAAFALFGIVLFRGWLWTAAAPTPTREDDAKVIQAKRPSPGL